MPSEIIEVEVDGLPVPVEKDEYEANPDDFEAAVRKARAEYHLPEDHEVGPTFDEVDS